MNYKMMAQHRPGQVHQVRPVPHRLRGHLAPGDRAGERSNGARALRGDRAEECVGCNLCMHVCPVENCITMREVDTGKPYMNWTQDPRNPQSVKVAAE